MEISEHFKKIFSEKKDPLNDILGQDFAKRQLKSALLMNRHVLIVGAPGIGKTTLAKNVAKLLPEITVNDCEFHCEPKNPICPSCISAKATNKKIDTKKISGLGRFVRIQGSPDLTAEDLLGDIDPIKALKFGSLSMEAFTPGKIFRANNGILFFDEVNRCPERLQNALLQVLSEGKATIGSYSIDLPADFIFIGTLNPEDTSTEPLSDVFLDRFDLIYMNYPESLEIEKSIIESNATILNIKFPSKLFDMTVHFVRLLREDKKIEKKPSVRASIGLYERAQSNAFLSNRKQVSFADIEEAVISVISHRIRLVPSAKFLQTPSEYVKEEFKKFSSDYEELKSRKDGGEG